LLYKGREELTSHGKTSDATRPPDDVAVAADKYYADIVFGQHDFTAHAITTLNALRIMRAEVTLRLYSDARALEHGYPFGIGCNGGANENCMSAGTDNGAHPVTRVEGSDAMILANALSEAGLRTVYLNKKSVPAHESSCSGFTQDARAKGYRLPTVEEWQVAACGGKAGLENISYGFRFAGSDNAKAVAWLPDFNEPPFGTARVKSLPPDAISLYGMSGNVSEGINAFNTFSGLKMYCFCGGSFLMHTGNLAGCDRHSAGYALPETDFRVVRKL